METARKQPVMRTSDAPSYGSGTSGAGDAKIVDFVTYSKAVTKMAQAPEAEDKAVADYAGLLLRIAEHRDRSAFIEIYKHFAPRVKSFLIGQRLPEDVAEEVVQEVMLAVWNKSRLFNPEKAAASTWIFAIARNKRIDRIRKDTNPDLDAEEPSLQPADFDQADDSLLDSQRKAAIGAALAELSEDQRNVIELSFMKGLSHGEIAEQLGLPLGTVKSRIRLAFQHLRGELGGVL